jgi:hypothetical protein
VLSSVASASFSERAFPLHGYWAGVAKSVWGGDQADPRSLKVPPQAQLLEQYQKLAFFPPQPGPPELLAPALESRIRARHVLVVGLETAPRAFYALTSSAELPTFRRMTERAIVSEHHYTTSPYTRIANFSMISGLYASPSGLPVRFGDIAADGFAAILRERGYQTSYVDSWVLDWLPDSGERAQAQMLGFDSVLDNPERRDDGVFEVLLRGEERAFDTAFARIVMAEEQHQKAAIFLGTMLGHAPWPAARGDEALDGPARVHKIAAVFDRLFGRLLQRLSERGLSEEILILVVGDHGLRFEDEFQSLGHSYSHSDLAFNVPFLLYAPGLTDTTLHVPFATSHVDITPTLLHLVGVPTEGLLHHGGYVLDGRLARRVLFLSNSRLGPMDGFRWGEHHVTFHALTGAAQIGSGTAPSSMLPLAASPATQSLPGLLRDPENLLGAFAVHTDLVAGALLRRGAANGRRASADRRR